MAKRIVWTGQAKADIRGIEQPVAIQILKTLGRYVFTGEGATKQLRGITPPMIRLRAQNHRVFLREHEGHFQIERVLEPQRGVPLHGLRSKDRNGPKRGDGGDGAYCRRTPSDFGRCGGGAPVFECYVPSFTPVALVGVENLVIVETADALLVASRSSAQDVSKIVKRLDAQGREELL